MPQTQTQAADAAGIDRPRFPRSRPGPGVRGLVMDAAEAEAVAKKLDASQSAREVTVVRPVCRSGRPPRPSPPSRLGEFAWTAETPPFLPPWPGRGALAYRREACRLAWSASDGFAIYPLSEHRKQVAAGRPGPALGPGVDWLSPWIPSRRMPWALAMDCFAVKQVEVVNAIACLNHPFAGYVEYRAWWIRRYGVGAWADGVPAWCVTLTQITRDDFLLRSLNLCGYSEESPGGGHKLYKGGRELDDRWIWAELQRVGCGPLPDAAGPV